MNKVPPGKNWRQKGYFFILSLIAALAIGVPVLAALSQLLRPTRGSLTETVAIGIAVMIGIVVMELLSDYLEKRL